MLWSIVLAFGTLVWGSEARRYGAPSAGAIFVSSPKTAQERRNGVNRRSSQHMNTSSPIGARQFTPDDFACHRTSALGLVMCPEAICARHLPAFPCLQPRKDFDSSRVVHSSCLKIASPAKLLHPFPVARRELAARFPFLIAQQVSTRGIMHVRNEAFFHVNSDTLAFQLEGT